MIEKIDSFIHRWWFAASSVALAIIYFLYQRRGRTIDDLHAEAQKQLLAQKLSAIKERAALSQSEASNASQEYARLKSRHADLLAKLGLLPAPTKPNLD